MTNDTATQAAHADYVLLNLAEQVADAEQAVRTQVNQVQDILIRVQGRLDAGRSLNELGELQSAGSAVDIKVAALEAAAKAFTQAHSYLGRYFPNQGKDEANQVMQDMFDRQIAKSIRLQDIVR
jgi:G3E family GTPase